MGYLDNVVENVTDPAHFGRKLVGIGTTAGDMVSASPALENAKMPSEGSDVSPPEPVSPPVERSETSTPTQVVAPYVEIEPRVRTSMPAQKANHNYIAYAIAGVAIAGVAYFFFVGRSGKRGRKKGRRR